MPASDPQPDPPAVGLKAAFDGFTTQAARYAGARMALVRLEASEAGADFSRRIKVGVAGVVLLIFSYPLLLAGLIGLAEHHRPGTWPIAALIAAACHLLMGIPFLFAALRKGAKPWFADSLNQIKEDEQWLRNQSTRPTENKTPNS